MLQNFTLGFLELIVAQVKQTSLEVRTAKNTSMLNIKCLLGSQWGFPSSNLQMSLTIFAQHIFPYPAEISVPHSFRRAQTHSSWAKHGGLRFFLGFFPPWGSH